ncbi:uncharacterized protein LOC126376282 [Pectinophora gossypiella]|uniref:uncharacterized protein LOC126376282 n=1 Tax=Pectinophora gossypiella TaxID=13191 RepID=UPI00214EA8A0|nr:uncharacterized protein LOC126376282 [Pectinophora gossypiella]XP_049879552.1 uncharacterized protein LOC126376282 [Pectinophora gossypiella]
MECLPENEILEFQPDTLLEVRKMFNMEKPQEMNEAIDILETWVQQQNHFVKKDFSRDYLERMIITAKGSVERAKGRLDKLCTFRTLMPYFFENYDVRRDFKDIHDAGILYSPLPKMTKDYERIFFIKNPGKSFTTPQLLNGFKICALMSEYLKAHDYAASYRFVADLREINITEFMTKVGIMDFRNLMTLLTEGYGMRLSGIHLMTEYKFIETFVALLRSVMSEKIGGRIRVHRTVESVYEFAPKEVLPKEYGEGGEDRTLDEIHEKWMQVLSTKEFTEYLRGMNAANTDESLRQTDKFNDQYMGMPGTFRTLRVD